MTLLNKLKITTVRVADHKTETSNHLADCFKSESWNSPVHRFLFTSENSKRRLIKADEDCLTKPLHPHRANSKQGESTSLKTCV